MYIYIYVYIICICIPIQWGKCLEHDWNGIGIYYYWLVVSAPLKNMKVNWDDDIPN